MKRTLFSLFALLLIVSLNAQNINVVRVDTASAPSGIEGLFYNLGQTKLEIVVSVTKIERIKGPYSEFAGKYLGLSNVISQNSTSYALNDISIRPVVVPDPEQYYFVEISPKAGKDAQPILMQMSNAGLLLSTDGSTPEIQPEESNISVEAEENIFPDIFKYFSDLNLFEQVDTIIERTSNDTATIEKMVFRRTLVEKTPEQKAKDAADFIIKVKENRLNLISGYQEVNYDKETFTLMNQELENLETEYQKLFTGLTFTNTLYYRFSYQPCSQKPVDSVALFRFSDLRGILDTTNPNGKMVWLKINASGHTAVVKNYLSRKSQEKVKTRGYYYRMPEYADIRIFLGDKMRVSAHLLINQFGLVTYLPAKDAGIRFYPATSGIQQIEIGK